MNQNIESQNNLSINDFKSFIIPAIDIIDGKCVRLSQGDYSRRTTYSEEPLEVAARFEEAGFSRLHLVDLDGARIGKVSNINVLKRLASQTNLKIDFSGGIRSETDLKQVFESGATWACVGSMACTNPEKTKEWLHLYGGDKLIIGADTMNGNIRINGWKKETQTTIFELITSYKELIQYVMCTDISRDGMMNGTDITLYQKLKESFPELNIIASGGVSSVEDLRQLSSLGLKGAIVGKAFYEKSFIQWEI